MMQFISKPMAYGPQIITPSPLLAGEVGFAYATGLNSINGAPPYTYAVVSGALPAGLNIVGAAITGTPTTPSAFSFSLVATDSRGAKSNPAAFSLTVVPMIAITTTSPLPAGSQGVAYSTTLVATGGVSPYTWALVSGSLDLGLSLNTATGVISGTPANAETDTPTFQVQDSLGYEVQKTFTLTINSSYVAPTITTTSPLPGATINVPYSFSMAAINGTTPYTWTITSGTLPTGITFTNGVFGGTPTVSTTATLNIELVDAHPTTVGPQAFSLTVAAVAAQTQQVTFNPGVHAQTVNGNNSTSGELVEITCLKASITANPTLTTIVTGYSFWRTGVGMVTGPINGVTGAGCDFSTIDTTWNNLQSALPGFHCSVQILPYENLNSPFNANAGNFLVPTYINSSTTTYGNPNAGGNGSGWSLVNYQSPNYGYGSWSLWNANVIGEWNKLIQALGNHIMPNIAGFPQYNGLTFNKHPLCDAILDPFPTGNSGGFQSSPTTPSGYTASVLKANWIARTATYRTTVPNTIVGLMPDFEWSGGSVTDTINVVQAMGTNGTGLSCTDCTTFSNTNGIDLSDAQHAYVGDTWNGTTWSAGGSTPQIGLAPSIPTIQTGDYARGASKNTQAQALLCIQGAGYNTYKANILCVSMASSGTFNVQRDWFNNSGSTQTDAGGLTVPNNTNSFILKAVLQAGVGVNTVLPLNLMFGPSLNAVTPSGTSLIPSWTPITGQGTGLNILIYRNGVQVGSVAASAGTFTDSTVSTATPYSYTIAMSNSNGTGPQGAAMVGEIAGQVFSYSSSTFPAAISGGKLQSTGAAILNSSNFLAPIEANSGHNSGGWWYTTKQAPTAFTTQFTFQIPNLPATSQACGLTFTIQNTVSPPGSAGDVGLSYRGDANMAGYGQGSGQFPPIDSIGIKFDATPVSFFQNFPAGGLPNSTGLYLNGGPVPSGTIGLLPWNDLTPYPLNFYTGHVFSATIVYDGSMITMVLQDMTTLVQARFAWPLNLANTTNASGNYIGFVGGTSSTGPWECDVLTWSYSNGFNTRLATPTFNPAPGQYAGTQSVTITGPVGSSIYYTTNGLAPTSGSTLYSGAISVTANDVIQAVAIQSGFTDSLIGTGAYQIATANQINLPSGFAVGDGFIPVGYAYRSGSALVVADVATNNSAGAGWFCAPVTVSTFTCDFTLNLFHSGTTGGNGMCFVLQNSPPAYSSLSNAPNYSGGPTVVGSVANAMGYGGLAAAVGLLNSIAIAFDLFTQPNSVGLYTNGATPAGSQTTMTGITLNSNHPLAVVLSYNGTTLHFSITDTVTTTNFTTSWTVNIPSIVGGSTAYLGFTGGTGGATCLMEVTKLTHSSP